VRNSAANVKVTGVKLATSVAFPVTVTWKLADMLTTLPLSVQFTNG
jgi:hypothetical protein